MAAGGGHEPNLTPFIDLFSVLICFLLMTAAWLPLESMNTNIEKGPPVPTNADVPPPPQEKKVQLSLTLEPSKVVFRENEKSLDIVNVEGELDNDQISLQLQNWRREFPTQQDLVVNTASGVSYGHLITVYDLLVASDWPNVGINPQ